MTVRPPPRMRLEQVLEPVSRPVSVERDKTYPLLGVRWYGKGCHVHSTPSGDELKTKVLYRVSPHDVVYNKMWTKKGAFAIVDDGVAHTFATTEYPAFVAHPERVDAWFLRYALNTPNFVEQASAACRGTTSRARLNPKDFLSLEIPCPPLGEQRKIAAILASVDETIEKTEAVIAQLQVVKKAMMQGLLISGLTGQQSEVHRTPLEGVPKSWELCELTRLSKVVRGSTPRPAKDPRFFNGADVNWITVGELSKDDTPFLSKTTSQLTVDGARRSRFLKAGTVVLSNSGFGLGVPKILSIDGCANDGVAAFLDLDEKIEPLFLYYFLCSQTSHLREKVARGVEQPNLNTDLIGQIKLPVPERALQINISQRLLAMDQRLEVERQVLRELICVKQALMSVLLTGQVRVTPNEDTP